MPTLKAILIDRLINAKKTAVLGIGSELRGDDAAGILVAEGLRERLKKRPCSSKIKILCGGTAPENLTGEIKRFGPSHIIMVDTVEFREKPGTILLLRPNEVSAGVTFSTHKMPARTLAEYLSKTLDCDITMVGIQPASIEFGKPPSRHIKSSAKEVADAIYGALIKQKKKGG